MGKTRERMRQDMELRNFSPRTIEEYLGLARRFVAHYMKPPEQITRDEVRLFLLDLVNVRGYSRHTLQAYRAALKFLYEVTLGMPFVVERILAPKHPKKLPVVLSRDEAVALVASVPSLKYRASLTVMYGTGMRITEACSLRVCDINAREMLIRVQGKGQKERFVLMCPVVLEVLRQYRKAARPMGYLFPGRKPDSPVTRETVDNAFKAARDACGITKDVTPHALRHSFATYLVDEGAELDVVRALLGHASIRTTSIYTHTSMKRLRTARGPLDAEPASTVADATAPAVAPVASASEAASTRPADSSLAPVTEPTPRVEVDADADDIWPPEPRIPTPAE
jgi:site-specific recombinase XerD